MARVVGTNRAITSIAYVYLIEILYQKVLLQRYDLKSFAQVHV